MIRRALLMAKNTSSDSMVPMIHWKFDYTNENHPDVIPDLTGNGNDLIPYNFTYRGMTGYGEYREDWTAYTPADGVTVDTHNILASQISSDTYILSKSTKDMNSYIICVSGLDSSDTLQYIYGPEGESDVSVINLHNGYFVLPQSFAIVENSVPTGFYSGASGVSRVRIEQLPVLPESISFNGAAYCNTESEYKFPMDSGFTVILKGKYLSDSCGDCTIIGNTYTSTDYSFIIAYKNKQSYGRITTYPNYNRPYRGHILYMTPETFCNKASFSGIKKDQQVATYISVGHIRKVDNRIVEGGVSEVYIFDKTKTVEEIEYFIGNNIIPDPVVYYDVRKQGTFSTDTLGTDRFIDFSGNGIHSTIEAKNVTVPANQWHTSYSDDGLTFVSGLQGTFTYAAHVLTVSTDAASSIYTESHTRKFSKLYSSSSRRIKVSGLNAGPMLVSADIGEVKVLLEIASDGVYDIPSCTGQVSQSMPITDLIFSFPAGNLGMTIEFFSVSDYFQFTPDFSVNTQCAGFNTIMMLLTLDEIGSFVYDQRSSSIYDIALFAETNTIAFQARNSYGDNIINGIRNTAVTVDSLKGKNILVILKRNSSKEDTFIGSSFHINSSNVGQMLGTIKFRKFLGFDAFLSDWQISEVIKKYNLMEETDDIYIY